MEEKYLRKTWWYIGVGLLIILSTGCVGVSGSGQVGLSPDAKRAEFVDQSGGLDLPLDLWGKTERLKERARQYWQARAKKNLVATYDLHEPGFKRVVTLTGFLQGAGVSQVLAFEILGARIEGSLGVVQVKFQAVSKHPLLVKPAEPVWYEVEEQWILVDREWFRKFRFSSANPYPPVDWDEMARQGRKAPVDLPKEVVR
jgi:hypothetical protein